MYCPCAQILHTFITSVHTLWKTQMHITIPTSIITCSFNAMLQIRSFQLPLSACVLTAEIITFVERLFGNKAWINSASATAILFWLSNEFWTRDQLPCKHRDKGNWTLARRWPMHSDRYSHSHMSCLECILRRQSYKVNHQRYCKISRDAGRPRIPLSIAKTVILAVSLIESAL